MNAKPPSTDNSRTHSSTEVIGGDDFTASNLKQLQKMMINFNRKKYLNKYENFKQSSLTDSLQNPADQSLVRPKQMLIYVHPWEYICTGLALAGSKPGIM